MEVVNLVVDAISCSSATTNPLLAWKDELRRRHQAPKQHHGLSAATQPKQPNPTLLCLLSPTVPFNRRPNLQVAPNLTIKVDVAFDENLCPV